VAGVLCAVERAERRARALTDRVIDLAIHEDTSEAVDGETKALPDPNASRSVAEE
jgi:hypothetical protein